MIQYCKDQRRYSSKRHGYETTLYNQKPKVIKHALHDAAKTEAGGRPRASELEEQGLSEMRNRTPIRTQDP